jgi:hypothetical protein
VAEAVDAPARLRHTGCDAAALSHASVTRCLAGRHLLMVGDSIMRYEYMGLAAFLSTGSWTPWPDRPCDYHHFWPDFNEYYKECSARLRGDEICDCYRIADVEDAEVHYFANAAGVRVTYVHTESLVNNPNHAHNAAFLNATCAAPPCAQAGCAVGACSIGAGPAAAPDATLPAIVRAITAALPVEVLLLNTGVHAPIWDGGTLAQVRGVAAAVRESARGGGAALIFKSSIATNGRVDSPNVDPAFERAAFDEHLRPDGWRLFDAFALTADGSGLRAAFGALSPFFDLYHVRPAVNRGVTEALLLDLCFADDAPLGAARFSI